MKKELTRDELLTRAVVFTAVTGSIIALPHAGEAALPRVTGDTVVVDQTDGMEFYQSGITGSPAAPSTNTYSKVYNAHPSGPSESSSTRSDQTKVLTLSGTDAILSTISERSYEGHKVASGNDWYHYDATAAHTHITYTDTTNNNDRYISASKTYADGFAGGEFRAVDDGSAVVVVNGGTKAQEMTLTSGNLRQKAYDAATGQLIDSTDYHGAGTTYADDGGTVTIVVNPTDSRAINYTSALLLDEAHLAAAYSTLPSFSDVDVDLSKVTLQAQSGSITIVNGKVTLTADKIYASNKATVTRPTSHETTHAAVTWTGDGIVNIGTGASNMDAPKTHVVLNGVTNFNTAWTDYAGNTVSNASKFFKLNSNGTLEGQSNQFFTNTAGTSVSAAGGLSAATQAGSAISFNGGTLLLNDKAITDAYLESAQDAVDGTAESSSLYNDWRNAIKNGGEWTRSLSAPSEVRSTLAAKDITPVTKTTALSAVADRTYAGELTVPTGSLVTDDVNVNGHTNAANQFNLIDYHTYVTGYDSASSPDKWLASSDPSVSNSDTDGDRKNIHASHINFTTAPTRILIGDERHLTLSDGWGNELLQVGGNAPTAPVKLTVEGNSVLTLGGTVNSDNTLRANIALNGTATRTDVATGSSSSTTTAGAVLEITNGTKTVNGITSNNAGIVIHQKGALTVDDSTTSDAADGTISTNSSRITMRDRAKLKAKLLQLVGSTVDVEDGSVLQVEEIRGTDMTLNYKNALASDERPTQPAQVIHSLNADGSDLLYNSTTGQSTHDDDTNINVGSTSNSGDLQLDGNSTITGSRVNVVGKTWPVQAGTQSSATLDSNRFNPTTNSSLFANASTYSDQLLAKTVNVQYLAANRSGSDVIVDSASNATAKIDKNALDYQLTVGQNSVAALGSDSQNSKDTGALITEAQRVFRESRLMLSNLGNTERKNVTAALYLESPITLSYDLAAEGDVYDDKNYVWAGKTTGTHTGVTEVGSAEHRKLVGGLTVDGSKTGADAAAGKVAFGADSLLMVNAANIGDSAIISAPGPSTADWTGATISVDKDALLYLSDVSNGQKIQLIKNLSIEDDGGQGWLDKTTTENILTYPLYRAAWNTSATDSNDYSITTYRKSVTDSDLLPNAILKNGVDGIPDTEINKNRSVYPGVRLVKKLLDNLEDTYHYGSSVLSTNAPITHAQATEILNLAGNPSEAVGATANALRQTTVLAEEANGHFSAFSSYAFNPSSIRNTPAGPASAFSDADRDGEIWFKAAHQRSETEGLKAAGNATDYDSKFNTFTLGYDFPQTQQNMRHGLSVSYGTGDGEQAHLSDDMKILGLSYYASLANKNNNLLLDAGYYETEHEVSGSLPYIGDRLDADSKTKVFTLGVTNEFVQKERNNVLVPHIGLRYSHVSTPSYTGRLNGETAFRYSPESSDIFTLPIGVGFKRDIRKGDTTYHFLADFSYIPVLSGRDATMRTHLIGGGVDSFDNDVVSRNSYRAKLSFLAENDRSSYGLDYSYRGSSDTTSHYIGARFNFKF